MTDTPVFALAPERFDATASALLFTANHPEAFARRFEVALLDLWQRQAGSRSSPTLGGATLAWRGGGHARRLAVGVKGFPTSLDRRPLADVLVEHLNLYAQEILARFECDDAAKKERLRREAEEVERERARLAEMCGTPAGGVVVDDQIARVRWQTESAA